MSAALVEKVAQHYSTESSERLASMDHSLSDANESEALAALVRAGGEMYELADYANEPCADVWSRALAQLAAALGVKVAS